MDEEVGLLQEENANEPRQSDHSGNWIRGDTSESKETALIPAIADSITPLQLINQVALLYQRPSFLSLRYKCDEKGQEGGEKGNANTKN